MINDVWCACFSRYSFELLIWSANRTMPYTMPTRTRKPKYKLQGAHTEIREFRWNCMTDS